jgi:hypothetical protein
VFFIPGQIIAALTFPGVIVHEIAHLWFCRIFGVAVLDVCYFRFGNPAGYVLHERPVRPSHQIWIAIGPFLVNSVIGGIIAAPASIQVFQLQAAGPVDFLLIWLGVSIAMHAFPSVGDAKTLRTAMSAVGVPLRVKLIAYPIIGIIFLGTIGSYVWLDAVYGVAVAVVGPMLLVALLA